MKPLWRVRYGLEVFVRFASKPHFLPPNKVQPADDRLAVVRLDVCDSFAELAAKT